MKLAIFSVLSFLRPQRYPQSPSLSHRERVALLVPGWSHRRYRRTGPLRSESSRRMPKKCNSWMTTSKSCCQAGGPGPLTGSSVSAVPPGDEDASGRSRIHQERRRPVGGEFRPAAARSLSLCVPGRWRARARSGQYAHFGIKHPGMEHVLRFGFAADGHPDVPHGAVASVFYYSQVLKTTRRMHIYIPPGYEERIRTEGDSS